MHGITLYIILGVLVGAVIIFLFVTSLLDHKKRKKFKKEKIVEDKERRDSNIWVAIILAFIIKQNELLLKDFVPSVGKLKMSNIRTKAHNSLSLLEKSKPFLFVKSSENQELIKIFKKLKENNSNIWKKRLINEIKIISNLIKFDNSIKITDHQIKEIIQKIKKVYKNESTK